jgi:type III secretory pathway component EscV
MICKKCGLNCDMCIDAQNCQRGSSGYELSNKMCVKSAASKKVGLIVGLSVGGFVLLIVIIIFVICCKRAKAKKKEGKKGKESSEKGGKRQKKGN